MLTTVTMNAAIDKLYLVDSLEPGSVMRVRTCHDTAGGKGLNVARVAALAGEKVRATGIVGGCNGTRIEAMLAGQGIESDFAHASVETRCCINVRNLATGEHTEFLEPGAEVDAAVLEDFRGRYRAALRQSEVVAISGSMPAGTPADYYARLVRDAKAQGRQVILDASGEALRLGLEAGPTMIKPNADEIRQLLDVDVDSREALAAAALQLCERGVQIVAISLGGDGVIVATGEGVFHGAPPAVEVVNTVGCGDSMVAGFALGLRRRLGIVETIRFAVAVSAANAMRMETGCFDASDLAAILPRVSVRRLQ